jgi:hypothetical protein
MIILTFWSGCSLRKWINIELEVESMRSLPFR